MEDFVYESKKAIVRIHTGQRSEEERRKALEEAVKHNKDDCCNLRK